MTTIDKPWQLLGSGIKYILMGLTSSLLYNTGPDGIRDHQASVLDPNTYVGIGTMSPEGTSDLNYLWRPSRV